MIASLSIFITSKASLAMLLSKLLKKPLILGLAASPETYPGVCLSTWAWVMARPRCFTNTSYLYCIPEGRHYFST